MATSFVRVKGVLPKASNVGYTPPELYKALDKIGRRHIIEHQKTVAAWTGAAPTFGFSITNDATTTTLTVRAEGSEEGLLKYFWIDQGTKPHEIFPTRAEFLVFRSPYYPSTEPRVIGSRAASRGDDINIRYSVQHPGVEPREFTKTINENLAEHDRQQIEQAGFRIK